MRTRLCVCVFRMVYVCVWPGCIDLSKRRVAASDRVKCEDRYKKACTVQSMLGHISLTLKVPLEDLCRRISFPLYKRFGHAYDAFQLADRCVWWMLLMRLECCQPSASFAVIRTECLKGSAFHLRSERCC